MRRSIWRLCAAFGTAFDELAALARLLPARAAANRRDGDAEYYASTARQDDVARLGLSRGLSKRQNESWEEFEERVRAFVGLEVWDGTRWRFSLTGDVAEWGCMTGMVRELERTGLVVDEIYGALSDYRTWRLLDIGDPEGDGLNDSMMLAVGSLPPITQRRLTMLYDIGADIWTLWITLTNPDDVEYLADEVRSIVKAVKPPWVRANVLFPGAEDWEVVDG